MIDPGFINTWTKITEIYAPAIEESTPSPYESNATLIRFMHIAFHQIIITICLDDFHDFTVSKSESANLCSVVYGKDP